MKVEEKLYNNRYMVDEGHPHIAIVAKGAPSPALKSLVTVCPAGCYAEEEDGSVVVTPDGCLECGTCRVICAGTGELQWDYPRGGYGILFKFG
ncbi:ferredoxin family protein [Magnetospirillum aberrantis]|uniref:Ferredoxin-like protein n=1 Tax=Magnetospirillum aberrantis SpK TaxID=908842 RepID=A0A7C9QRZ6_9PROT|nr:ferredoxin family protein [Magnetospirillum aberrantis]NFV79125.1 ferredoxin family protein [Magnetospirillum aberrantis SpK]